MVELYGSSAINCFRFLKMVRLRYLLLLLWVSVAGKRDSHRPNKTVKIPDVVQRMYHEWSAKPDYEPKTIQSIPVQVTHLEEQTLLMTAPFSRARTSPVENAVIWMELHNSKQHASEHRVPSTAYISPTTNEYGHSCRAPMQPIFIRNQLRLRINITSLHLNCTDERENYLQFTMRLETDDSSDVDLGRMDVFLILEMVEEDAGSLTYVVSHKMGMKAFRRQRKGRSKRGALQMHQFINRRKNVCRIKKWFVKFDDLRWDWVVAPPVGFNANRCKGRCFFPLPAYTNTTIHAVIQTLMNSIYGKPRTACCVAKEFRPLTMLFQEDNGNILMKMYPDMVVTNCGCL